MPEVLTTVEARTQRDVLHVVDIPDVMPGVVVAGGPPDRAAVRPSLLAAEGFSSIAAGIFVLISAIILPHLREEFYKLREQIDGCRVKAV